MPATLTAVPDPTHGRIQLVWTGATVGDTMTRDGLPVRYPPISSAAGTLYDYEAQPGRTHTYTLSGASATATLPDGGCDGAWYVHPTKPQLSMKLKTRWDQPQEWTAPGTIHEVMGSRPPLVTHTARTYHKGQVQFWTPIDLEDEVVALFEDGTPILINPPTCCTPVLRYEWTWGSLSARLAGDDVTGRSGWWWTYEYQRVGTPAGHIEKPDKVANTYAGVLADTACHPIYDKLADPIISTQTVWTPCGHPDYEDVLVTPHPHGAKP